MQTRTRTSLAVTTHLHEQIDQFLEQRDRLNRFRLGPHMPTSALPLAYWRRFAIQANSPEEPGDSLYLARPVLIPDLARPIGRTVQRRVMEHQESLRVQKGGQGKGHQLPSIPVEVEERRSGEGQSGSRHPWIYECLFEGVKRMVADSDQPTPSTRPHPPRDRLTRLDPFGSFLDGGDIAGERVLGEVSRGASVSEDTHTGGHVGERGRRCRRGGR